MATSEPSRPARSYRPEQILSARRAFFDDGRQPVGLVDDAVLRSWKRCSALGRRATERVEFQPVSALSDLLERNRALLEAGRPELSTLAAAVADAGYAVLLTDARSNILAADGAIAARSATLRRAFRAGVDLSEAAIGTNAPVVAMWEGHTARVFGAEHFYDDTQIFQCFASPVFDPEGEVAGSVDVSCDTPGMLDSVLWLSERCAQRIERRLFQAVRARLHVEIDIAGDGFPTAASGAWLALGDGGELLAASPAARRLMALPAKVAGLAFDQLFDERFESWNDRISAAATSVPTRLHGGVRLRVQRLPGTAAPRRVGLSHRRRAAAGPVADPRFGDERLDRGFEEAACAFRADLPVLLTGETGCGKEVVARALHESGERAAGPFVAVNCAAIPGELLASELFGHVEGAFTGSRRSGAVGKIEAAQSGTLFLDEIGDMPLALQAALLRVMDTREVVPLGSNEARPVDANVVCATHRDLRALIDRGSFREDFYYRVAGHVFHIIPLRERRDLDAVLDAVLARLGWEPDRIPAAVRQRLRAAPWPGNVRQLQHAVQRALALAGPTSPVAVADLPPEIWSGANGAAEAEGVPAPGGWLRRATDEAIARALEQSGGDVAAAARLLGIGRATLYRRLARNRV